MAYTNVYTNRGYFSNDRFMLKKTKFNSRIMHFVKQKAPSQELADFQRVPVKPFFENFLLFAVF